MKRKHFLNIIVSCFLLVSILSFCGCPVKPSIGPEAIDDSLRVEIEESQLPQWKPSQVTIMEGGVAISQLMNTGENFPFYFDIDLVSGGDSVAQYQWLSKNKNRTNVLSIHAITAGSIVISATDSRDSTKFVQLAITVQKPAEPERNSPIADFKTDKSSGTAPLSVQFTDKSSTPSGSLTSWLWEFGDGNSSTEKSPHYTFEPGNWNITLTVTNSLGLSGKISKNITAGKPGEPILFITPNVLDFDGNETVLQFAIQNTGQETLNWQIFENSSWLTINKDAGINNDNVTVSVERSGLTVGNYSDSVRVTSNGGNDIVVVEMSVAVGDTIPPTNHDPEITAFSVEPRKGPVPLTVNYSAEATDADGDALTFNWNFDDGQTATGKAGSHEYTQVNTYTLRLTVTDGNGGEAKMTQAITVEDSVVVPPIVTWADSSIGSVYVTNTKLTDEFQTVNPAGNFYLAAKIKFTKGLNSQPAERAALQWFVNGYLYQLFISDTHDIQSGEIVLLVLTQAPVPVGENQNWTLTFQGPNSDNANSVHILELRGSTVQFGGSLMKTMRVVPVRLVITKVSNLK